MKESLNDSTHNQPDLLLFEYLEGELTETQKMELEKKLTLDPDLQSELDCWKESFIEQEFYNTEKLESTLLDIQLPVKSWYSHASLNIFVLLMVSGMFSFLPLNLDEEKHLGNPSMAVTVPVDTEKSEEETARPALPVPKVAKEPLMDISVERSMVENPAQEAPSAIPSGKEYQQLNYPTVNSQPARTEVSLTGSYIPAGEIKKVKVKSTTSTISRKQERRIRKMKEKALQERMAREFMKGNRAYVVPLNTTNF